MINEDLKLNAIFTPAYRLIKYVKINFYTPWAMGELHAIYYTW